MNSPFCAEYLKAQGVEILDPVPAKSGWIICKWKQAGAYTLADSVNGKVYKSQAIAESVERRFYQEYDYVVRSI
jgi:hypothetical protein